MLRPPLLIATKHIETRLFVLPVFGIFLKDKLPLTQENKQQMDYDTAIAFQKTYAPNIAVYIDPACKFATDIVTKLHNGRKSQYPDVIKKAKNSCNSEFYWMQYLDFAIHLANTNSQGNKTFVGLGYSLEQWKQQDTPTVPWCVMFWNDPDNKDWIDKNLIEKVCKQKRYGRVLEKAENPKGEAKADLWVELPTGIIIENEPVGKNADRLYGFLKSIAQDLDALF